MKTQKQITLIIMAAFSLLAASCKKDTAVMPGTGNTNSGGSNPPVSTQLVRIDQDASNYSAISYDASGLVASYLNLHDGIETKIVPTYDANKKPLSAIVNNASYKFIYNSAGRLNKVEIYNDKNKLTDLSNYITYTYTGNQVTGTDYFGKAADGANFNKVLSTVSTYDAAGDIATQKVYYISPATQAPVLSSATAYKYDNKVNPLSAVYDFTAIIFGAKSVHNPVSQIITDVNDKVTETDTFTINYNSNGYPKQITTKSIKPGSADVTVVSKLTYK